MFVLNIHHGGFDKLSKQWVTTMTFLNNHRGPYRFCVCRPMVAKAGFFRSQWLTGVVDRDDVEGEARALLDDPRDTISRVDVWSIREECFIGGYNK